jgi:hypothetical protein
MVRARVNALTPATGVASAHIARPDELAAQPADAIAHCERLAVTVEGDLRSGKACG